MAGAPGADLHQTLCGDVSAQRAEGAGIAAVSVFRVRPRREA